MLKRILLLVQLIALGNLGLSQAPVFEKIAEISDAVNEINCIKVQQQNTVWVGTNKGLFKITELGVEQYFDTLNQKKFKINTICIDDQERIWLGTYMSSIILFDNTLGSKEIKFSEFTNDEFELVTGITVNGESMLIVTSEGSLIKYDISTNTLEKLESPTQSDIYSVFLSENKTPYLCAVGGFYYKKDEKSKWKKIKGLNLAYGIYNDGKKNWVVGKDELNQNVIMFYGQAQLMVFGFTAKVPQWNRIVIAGLPKKYTLFNDLDFDISGNIWIAVQDAIVRYNPQTDQIAFFNKESYDDFDFSTVKSVAVQTEDIIWAASEGNQIYKIILRQ